MGPEIHADRSLSCRLERAEGLTNAEFVEARARLMPQSGAKWISVAGALAMFDGVDSPWTQTFGLGLFQMPTAPELTAIELSPEQTEPWSMLFMTFSYTTNSSKSLLPQKRPVR